MYSGLELERHRWTNDGDLMNIYKYEIGFFPIEFSIVFGRVLKTIYHVRGEACIQTPANYSPPIYSLTAHRKKKKIMNINFW